MTLLIDSPLNSLSDLEIFAARAEVVELNGTFCLRLENGLALLRGFTAKNVTLEVSICAEGACYPGLAFRARDNENYELAYAQPHTSGGWDALQYDPVMHNSNTWQVFFGKPYQAAAQVPTGHWFRLKITCFDQRAAICVDDQPPLIVEELAYDPQPGSIGLWSYLPAYFRDLRVTESENIPASGEPPTAPANVLDAWLLEGSSSATTQTVRCEPNGVLCLNRYLSPTAGEAMLSRQFSLSAADSVSFQLGYSDIVQLIVDGELIYQGENTYRSGPDWATRGYAAPGSGQVVKTLTAGEHLLSASVRVTEPFGWGLILQATPPPGVRLDWLPVGDFII